MRSDNKGLTVKINLWSLDSDLDEFDSTMARLWMKGQVTHADTGEVSKFNDAGELVSILGKWNALKYRDLKARKRTAHPSSNL